MWVPASLARLEAIISLETPLAGLPNLRRTEGDLDRVDSFLVRGPTRTATLRPLADDAGPSMPHQVLNLPDASPDPEESGC